MVEADPTRTAGARLSGRASSERVRLSRLALAQALAVEGVIRADSGPLGTQVTLDGRERLAGVTAAALPEGRYGVTLHLVAQLVPLHELGGRIRARIKRAASLAGIGDALGPVDLVFEDIADSPEGVV